MRQRLSNRAGAGARAVRRRPCDRCSTSCRWRSSCFAANGSSTRILPATRLVNRLRSKFAIELQVMLLDHLAQSRERSQPAGTAFTLTAQDNEPFVVNLMELRGRHGDVAVQHPRDRHGHLCLQGALSPVAAGESGRRAGAPRFPQQPDRGHPRHHAGDDQETPLANLRKGRRRLARAAGRQTGVSDALPRDPSSGHRCATRSRILL